MGAELAAYTPLLRVHVPVLAQTTPIPLQLFHAHRRPNGESQKRFPARPRDDTHPSTTFLWETWNCRAGVGCHPTDLAQMWVYTNNK